ncbi:proline dehydrogenase [Balamuthia mandrillaris]
MKRLTPLQRTGLYCRSSVWRRGEPPRLVASRGLAHFRLVGQASLIASTSSPSSTSTSTFNSGCSSSFLLSSPLSNSKWYRTTVPSLEQPPDNKGSADYVHKLLSSDPQKVDTEFLYHSQTTGQLLFALSILRLCMSPFIVETGPKILAWAEGKGVAAPIYWFMKRTFFRHFCAGETNEEVHQTIQRYLSSGIRSYIPDCSVEDSLTEEAWQKNTQDTLALMQLCSRPPNKGQVFFVPIKITALCSPTLLERMTSNILYRQERPALAGPAPVWLGEESYHKSSAFPLYAVKVPEEPPLPLTPEEEAEFSALMQRLRSLCQTARDCELAIFLDAEQTYRQPAINHISRLLAREFNHKHPDHGGRAIVHNTFQLYLKENLENLRRELQHAKQNGYILGAKIVRGAYMHSESIYSVDNLCPIPFHNSKERTDKEYNDAIPLLLDNLQDASLVLATHNIKSIRECLKEMEQRGLSNSHPRIHFAQLMGICDGVSLALAKVGLNEHKLLPYGPIRNVMPYLVRRMQENSSIFGGIQRERALMRKELRRRLLPSLSQ